MAPLDPWLWASMSDVDSGGWGAHCYLCSPAALPSRLARPDPGSMGVKRALLVLTQVDFKSAREKQTRPGHVQAEDPTGHKCGAGLVPLSPEPVTGHAAHVGLPSTGVEGQNWSQCLRKV